MVNSVRVAYIVCHTIGRLCMLAGAMLAPLYITPGHYGWSVLLVVFAALDGTAYGKRMDLWTGQV